MFPSFMGGSKRRQDVRVSSFGFEADPLVLVAAMVVSWRDQRLDGAGFWFLQKRRK